MKKETRMLLGKGVNSLGLSIEHFNALDERGRLEAVLIFLDHGFEMLLKACLLQRGDSIREPGEKQTIGFDACVRKGLTGTARFLSDDQALALQTINGLRDAAQHHLIDVSEAQLYLHSQAGVTLFGDLLDTVFGRRLVDVLPPRALPLSTVPPTDISVLFEREIAAIKQLLGPRRRRRTEAFAKLRPLAILDATIRGEKIQPDEADLSKIAERVVAGHKWEDIFAGAAVVQFTTEHVGPRINLRLTKTVGVPVRLVPEGTPDASVIGVKRVNELDFYNLGRDDVAKHLNISGPRATALIAVLRIKENPEHFKRIVVGKVVFDRYSQLCLVALRKGLAERSIEDVWTEYRAGQRRRR
jgi:hypothetical protein